MPLIHCIMASASPPDAAAKCLSGLGIVTTSAARIEQCAASARGEALLHEVGIRTQTLDPPLDFVPWLTFNDVSEQRTVLASAVKRSIGSITGCTITEKAPTRDPILR